MPIIVPHIFAITLSQITYFLPLICILNKYYSANQKVAMGELSDTYRGKEGERVTSRFSGGGKLRENDH